MITKTYKSNINEAVLSFILGKAVIKCAFTGGRDNVPAKFTTSDPIVQIAIERDARYGRTILLARTVGDDKKVREGKEEKKDVGKKEPVVVEDVADVNGVIEWLKDNGVPHQSLRSVKNIRKMMDEKGVTFPNVVFPEE